MAGHVWDVVIAGGGPAGLNAALVLGRSRRNVLLCDSGTPRSWASKAMHGFLTRDGVSPADFRQLARSELSRYENVSLCAGEVKAASRLTNGLFEVRVHGRRPVRCRKMLIATGVFDQLPAIPDIARYFGVSVFQCPYCDGWERRGLHLAAYGKRRRGFEMARALTAWTADVTLCTDGASSLSGSEKRHLANNNIQLVEERIDSLDGEEGRLRAIVFRSGRTLQCSALFFDMPTRAQSSLAQSLGCEFTKNGGIKCGRYEATSVPGVFVAGNIIKDVQLAIVAAAEGARAAFGINRALTREDFERKATGARRIEHPKLEDASA